MEHYVVSARKYRPRQFEDVVGQQAITATLQQAIATGHLAQALLFCGPRGVGKTTCARILARAINASQASDSVQDFSFNLFELDAASHNSVDDIRSLTDQVRFAPQVGKYKVYIIDEVHMLSQAAFNAFLKTLEEPPQHVIFILATTEKHKIIPTILSRCQIYDFKRIGVADIKAYLSRIVAQEGIQAADDALHLIAQKADGALRDALSLFDRVVSFTGKDLTLAAVAENLSILDYTYFFRATRDIAEGDYRALLLRYDSVLQRGFQSDLFLAGLAQHLRDLLVAKDPQTLVLLEVGEDLQKKYRDQAVCLPVSLLFESLEILNQALLNLKTSQDIRLTTEIALMQLAIQSTDRATLAGEPAPKLPTEKPTPAAPALSKGVVPQSATEKSASVKRKSTGRKSPFCITEKRNPEPEAASASLPAAPFDQAQLSALWNRFAKAQKERGNHSYALSLTACSPVLGSDFRILHTLSSSTLLQDFEKHQSTLTAFLRRELHNHQLVITTRLDEEKRAKRPYTPQEKYDYFVKKNPLVAKLRWDLGMDIDF